MQNKDGPNAVEQQLFKESGRSDKIDQTSWQTGPVLNAGLPWWRWKLLGERDGKVICPYPAAVCFIEEEMLAVSCRTDEMRKWEQCKAGIGLWLWCQWWYRGKNAKHCGWSEDGMSSLLSQSEAVGSLLNHPITLYGQKTNWRAFNCLNFNLEAGSGHPSLGVLPLGLLNRTAPGIDTLQ